MKKNKQKKSFVLIALLLLVALTSSYVAGTYAKYTAEVTGEGSATVAKWAFASDNDDVDFDINLDETYDASTLVADRIAPGTSGSFDIELSNENSEVGVEFTISFTNTANVPTNLVFTQGNNTVNPATQSIKGYIAAGETLTVPLTWEWAYETGTSPYTQAGEDPADTTDGIAAKTMTVTANIKGIQVAPSTTAITTGVTGVVANS